MQSKMEETLTDCELIGVKFATKPVRMSAIKKLKEEIRTMESLGNSQLVK